MLLISGFKEWLGYGLSCGGFVVGVFVNLLKFDKVLLFYFVSIKNKNKVLWDDCLSIDIV